VISSIATGWKFDLKTSTITILVAPVALYFLAVLRKYLKLWGSYALEGVMYWVSRFLKRSLAGALTLKRYCRMRLAEENRYLFVPSSLDVKLEVDEAFVRLTLDRQGGDASNHDHRDILTVGNRIRVIGDPGSGKSSLTKRLFRDTCYQALRRPSEARLPILVELKNLSVPAKQTSEKLGEWSVKKLRDAACKSKVYQVAECFDTYAENTGLLVLLDGLDEVSTSNYPRVQSAIIGLSQRLSQMSETNVIVMTMRTQFHQQIKNAFRDSFGHALFLRPFSPSDIYEFLTRWPFRSGREHSIARIYGELTDQPTLREMCSNPLILAMYVAEDQAAGHLVAPESRTEVYAKVTEELIVKRRLQQTGPMPAHTKLREQRERILGRLAYEHLLDHNQPTNSLEWNSAIRVTQDVMKCSERNAETLFREIAKETGLITEERTAQSFRFIHLTFCEFLAAYEAVQGQQNGWNRLVECHKEFQSNQSQPQLKSRLLEVIPFACGLLPRVNRELAISDTAAVNDDALLARCFLETKQYDHKAWPPFVQRQKSALVKTPESRWDDRWLRDLHLFNVVIKDAAQCSAHMAILETNVDLDQFFQALVGSQKDSLSKLLSAYATQDAPAVFRLAEVSNLDLATDFPQIVIANCDQAPFLALLVERALTLETDIQQWAALLTESALRSRAVAESLSNMEPSVHLRQRLSETPAQKRWFRTGVLRETLYTQLLTIASSVAPAEKVSLPFLNVLRPLPPPGAMRLNPLAAQLYPLLVIPLVWSLFEYFRHIASGHSGSFSRISPIVVTALAYSALPFAVTAQGRTMAYRALVLQRGVLDTAVYTEPSARDDNPSFMVIQRWVLARMFMIGVPLEIRKALKSMAELRSGGSKGGPQKL
jgi:hypothetical protein